MVCNAEKALVWVLRLLGIGMLLAIPAVFMPESMIAEAHEKWLGLGKIELTPVFVYLARSVSLFYAFFGGLFVLVSFDTRRHAIVVAYLGWVMLALGLGIGIIDHVAGLPLWWTLPEAALTVVSAAAVLVLLRLAGAGSGSE